MGYTVGGTDHVPIVSTIHRKPDLSPALDTIDHDNLFCILEKYVGICGNALQLIKSYFSNRTQRVHTDNVLSFCEYYLWCSSRLSFRTFKIVFVLFASERYFKVS